MCYNVRNILHFAFFPEKYVQHMVDNPSQERWSRVLRIDTLRFLRIFFYHGYQHFTGS